MAIRAGQLMAGEVLRINGLTVHGESRGEKPPLLLRPEPFIAQEVGVLGNPQQLLGSMLLPAVRTGDARQEAEGTRVDGGLSHEVGPSDVMKIRSGNAVRFP